MKKLFALLLTTILLLSLFCLPAAAANSDTVISVKALKKDATSDLVGDYSSFEDGWNAAMKLAPRDKLADNGYVSVVVDILADWHASGGEFADDGYGFNWDTICIPEEAVVIINLNGHIINRGLTDWENNGEVMYIDEDATVVINGGKDENDTAKGTITGGYSAQKGGGIHIKNNANVFLNNVNVINNHVEDSCGAGISLAKGASLKMNGGSVSGNRFAWTYSLALINDNNFGFGIYAAENCTIDLKGVNVSDNSVEGGVLTSQGAAIYTEENCDVTLTNCVFTKNGKALTKKFSARSIIKTHKSDLVISGCTFSDNGELFFSDRSTAGDTGAYMIRAKGGSVTINDSSFKNNTTYGTLYLEKAQLVMDKVTFTDNETLQLLTMIMGVESNPSTISNCVFNDIRPTVNGYDNVKTFYFSGIKNKENVVFTADNDFGSSTFKGKDLVTFLTAGNNNRAASIIGNGSFSMIVSLLALAATVCLGVMFVIEKRKTKKGS